MVTILQILGALGLFLYGMKVMSDGVQKFAGAKMRAALASVTGNRFKGVMTGVVTTGLVQSSSATTVLVVSFVNAGLLTLVESIGIIMGANLGTTLTAWIIAIAGKFSIADIAIPVIGIGFLLFFLGKGKTKNLGEFILGFGILFLGLGELKDAVPDLKSGVKEDESVIQSIRYWIDLLSNRGYLSYVLFMVAGIILTLLVQSSSAAMAITITCATNGWFGSDNFEAFRISAAIVMGENIGTTVTAWLASLAANTEAKRAARAHFLFNVIGTLWMLLVFWLFTLAVWNLVPYLPEWIKGAKEEYSNTISLGTAVFHTAFNLINICLLVWFVPVFARVVTRWVPDGKKASDDAPRLRYIARSLFELDELNILEAEKALEKMAAHTHAMFRSYKTFYRNPPADLQAELGRFAEMEEEADAMMHDITEYLVHCVARDTGEGNAARIAAMIRIATELEEVTDCLFRLAKMTEKKIEAGLHFADHHVAELQTVTEVVETGLATIASHLLKRTPEGVAEALRTAGDHAVSLRPTYNREAVLRASRSDIRLEILVSDINSQLMAIANHAFSIAEASDSVEVA